MGLEDGGVEVTESEGEVDRVDVVKEMGAEEEARGRDGADQEYRPG